MDKIFVQIAAYREPDLISTIKDLLSKAKHPERITFGIVRQYSPLDNGFDDLSEFKNDSRFNIVSVPATESKGIGWARSQVQKLWRGEKYTLQLDSHHRAIKDWDEEFIRLFVLAPSEKPVIGSYGTPFVPNYNGEETINYTVDPCILNLKGFCNQGGLPFECHAPTQEQRKKELLRGYAFGGHFFFTLGIFCKEVPYDPIMYNYGEEITMSLRSFSLGYDFFCPTKSLIWHYFGRQETNRHWDDFSREEVNNLYEPALLKLRNFLGTTRENEEKFEITEYGMEGHRTIEDYEMYAGVDFKNQRVYRHNLIEPPVFKTKEELNKWKETAPKTEWKKVLIDWDKLKNDLLPMLEEEELKTIFPVSVTTIEEFNLQTKMLDVNTTGKIEFNFFSNKEAGKILIIPHRKRNHRWLFLELNKYLAEEK